MKENHDLVKKHKNKWLHIKKCVHMHIYIMIKFYKNHIYIYFHIKKQTLWTLTAAMNLKYTFSLEEKQ